MSTNATNKRYQMFYAAVRESRDEYTWAHRNYLAAIRDGNPDAIQSCKYTLNNRIATCRMIANQYGIPREIADDYIMG